MSDFGSKVPFGKGGVAIGKRPVEDLDVIGVKDVELTSFAHPGVRNARKQKPVGGLVQSVQDRELSSKHPVQRVDLNEVVEHGRLAVHVRKDPSDAGQDVDLLALDPEIVVKTPTDRPDELRVLVGKFATCGRAPRPCR